jgi:hypothetical protein
MPEKAQKISLFFYGQTPSYKAMGLQGTLSRFIFFLLCQEGNSGMRTSRTGPEQAVGSGDSVQADNLIKSIGLAYSL